MQKIFIKNRKGQNLCVAIDAEQQPRGLAFVMHGLGGFKEHAHVETFARAFLEKGFAVARFDATNALGDSDGKIENATVTNYYEDLEDTIGWAQTQNWYQEPFVLAGHSLGGLCTALYAQKHPGQVAALAPISTVVSGALSLDAHRRFEPERLSQWKATGWREDESQTRPGFIRRLPWSHMEDRLNYDLLPLASKLTMPVLLITGENDTSTPPDHVKILFDALPGKKEFHIIKNAPHTFRDPQHLAEIKRLLSDWIGKH